MSCQLKQKKSRQLSITSLLPRFENPGWPLKKIGHIKRREVQDIQVAWEGGINGVLLVGDAGSGKTGVVLDLAKDLHRHGTPILFINAKELPAVEDPAKFIKERIPISDDIGIAFHRLGQEKLCVLIVDQLDIVLPVPKLLQNP